MILITLEAFRVFKISMLFGLIAMHSEETVNAFPANKWNQFREHYILDKRQPSQNDKLIHGITLSSSDDVLPLYFAVLFQQMIECSNDFFSLVWTSAQNFIPNSRSFELLSLIYRRLRTGFWKKIIYISDKVHGCQLDIEHSM